MQNLALSPSFLALIATHSPPGTDGGPPIGDPKAQRQLCLNCGAVMPIAEYTAHVKHCPGLQVWRPGIRCGRPRPDRTSSSGLQPSP
ncbi:MAG: hypothetical protein KGI59_02045 [Patescibacteria group bacterium]|nr:hypothetical protein [Patescibacteria group bacterium]